ncbi:MAG: hypothetical protein BGO81_04025 [Devosia sp. 66-22]|nr:MAG: hypothetical protein BGO81_04025 [Devosia sp. 66-22]
MESFALRFSIADIIRPGPFSPFPGVDRTLVVIDGEAVNIAIGCEPPKRLGRLEPLSFRGEDEAWAEPVSGDTRDFNVMSRRGAFSHEVTMVTPHEPLASNGAEVWAFLALVQTELAIAADKIELERLDLIWGETMDIALVTSRAGLLIRAYPQLT